MNKMGSLLWFLHIFMPVVGVGVAEGGFFAIESEYGWGVVLNNEAFLLGWVDHSYLFIFEGFQ